MLLERHVHAIAQRFSTLAALDLTVSACTPRARVASLALLSDRGCELTLRVQLGPQRSDEALVWEAVQLPYILEQLLHVPRLHRLSITTDQLPAEQQALLASHRGVSHITLVLYQPFCQYKYNFPHAASLEVLENLAGSV